MSDLNTPATVALMDQRPSTEVPARSPLHHLAGSQSAQAKPNTGVYLWEEALKTHMVLRGDGNQAAFREGVQEATGLALPGALTSVHNEDWSLSWIAPDEWLLVGPGDKAFTMEQQLRERLSGHYALINVGGGQTLVRLAGANARAVLMKSCPYDVHDRNFPVGKVVNTVLAKSSATLRRLGEQDWELVVRRSFADYVWHWLVDAAGEYGLHIGPSPDAQQAQRTERARASAVES